MFTLLTRGSWGSGSRSQVSNKGLGALYPPPLSHFQKGFSWLHHGAFSIPQRGEQMAGGEGSGCGSGDKVGHTSYILYSLQPALELEGWFLLAPGMQRFSNPLSDSGCAHSLAER